MIETVIKMLDDAHKNGAEYLGFNSARGGIVPDQETLVALEKMGYDIKYPSEDLYPKTKKRYLRQGLIDQFTISTLPHGR